MGGLISCTCNEDRSDKKEGGYSFKEWKELHEMNASKKKDEKIK